MILSELFGRILAAIFGTRAPFAEVPAKARWKRRLKAHGQKMQYPKFPKDSGRNSSTKQLQLNFPAWTNSQNPKNQK